MEQPQINPTPKQVFMSSRERIQAHRELMQRQDLDDSINTALMQYQRVLSSNPANGNFNEAAASHMKITGALEFVTVLRHLAETPTIASQTSKGNLLREAAN